MLFGSSTPKNDLPSVPAQVPETPTSRNAPPPVTVIAKGVRIEGDFGGDGDMRIDGEVSGKLTVGGTLTIGQDAKIKAEVKAKALIVSGSVEGNINVDDRVDLKATARVKGDVRVRTLAVEPGAVMHGSISAGTDQPAVATSHASAQPKDEKEQKKV